MNKLAEINNKTRLNFLRCVSFLFKNKNIKKDINKEIFL